ncbi:hypothetical protein GE09DRAFT_37712 [Coniochaeta sp. 2T2.1]|nr:hypothetical protein GE09DRAFT_37712 [Coniochaeta sp. 2T2.1]
MATDTPVVSKLQLHKSDIAPLQNLLASMPPTYRKQYTSCDQCRKSRLGCDAAVVTSGSSCSNCLRRSKSCSFEWIQGRHGIGTGSQRAAHVRSRRAHATAPATASASTIALVNSDTERPAEPAVQSRDAAVSSSSISTVTSPEVNINRRFKALTLHHVLWDIFTTLFEPQLGIWIGNDCNPLKRLATGPLSPETVRKLGLRDVAYSTPLDRAEEDALINQALMSAVHVFAARWLPICHFREPGETETRGRGAGMRKELFVESLWHRARNDVLPILTRPSYRSILALYLFGITPTSLDNKDRAISDLCLETSLRQYVPLRSKARITPHQVPRDSTPTVGHGHGTVPETAATTRAQEEYAHLLDTAYWYGIVCDTSRCITRCQPSVLLPGLAGETKVWDLIRKQVDGFDMIYRSMHTSKAVLTDEMVLTIIQYGSSCKTLFWKAVARVQDYFVYHATDLSLDHVMRDVAQTLSQFEDVFGPLLDHCARDYLLLTEKSRISYLLLSFHFHLGVLILVDTLDVQCELPFPNNHFNIACTRLSSTRAIVNLINLTLQTDAYSTNSSSVLLQDPYPEHISNALSRAAHSILDLFHAMVLPSQTAESMASSLFIGLEILSQVSYTAGASLVTLHPLFADAKLEIKSRHSAPSHQLPTPVSMTADSPVTRELFEEETLRELGLATGDPSLVDKTIERHEAADVAQVLVVQDYLPWVEFDFATQGWGFEVCIDPAQGCNEPTLRVAFLGLFLELLGDPWRSDPRSHIHHF